MVAHQAEGLGRKALVVSNACHEPLHEASGVDARLVFHAALSHRQATLEKRLAVSGTAVCVQVVNRQLVR